MDNNSAITTRLLERARAGDKQAINELIGRHRARLRRMVELRLDRRLQSRIDASDVIQEAHVEVVTRLNEYLSEPKYPFFLWLRLIVGERLLKLHRHHLGTQMRDAALEVSLYRGALARGLFGGISGPASGQAYVTDAGCRAGGTNDATSGSPQRA